MQAVGAQIVDMKICKEHSFLSDDYIKCYLTWFATGVWHQSGTCKMGPSSDSNAVVSPTLKVHKVENLRVCDASIFPEIISGNLQCAVYMVGERCADFIINDWKMK